MMTNYIYQVAWNKISHWINATYSIFTEVVCCFVTLFLFSISNIQYMISYKLINEIEINWSAIGIDLSMIWIFFYHLKWEVLFGATEGQSCGINKTQFMFLSAQHWENNAGLPFLKIKRLPCQLQILFAISNYSFFSHA